MTTRAVLGVTVALLVRSAGCGNPPTQEVTSALIQFSEDGSPSSWQYMEWRPGVDRYMRFAVVGSEYESGPVRWGPAVPVDLCIYYAVDQDKVRFWLRDDAPPMCFPTETSVQILRYDNRRPTMTTTFAEPACRVCGCVDEDCYCCVMHTGDPCWWVDLDLCSACRGNNPCQGENDGIGYQKVTSNAPAASRSSREAPGILWTLVVSCRCEHAGTKCMRESHAVGMGRLLTLLAPGSVSSRGALGVVPRHHPRRLIPAAPHRSGSSIHWYPGLPSAALP